MWKLSFNPLCLFALLGCLFHMNRRRYGLPKVVSFTDGAGKTRRMLCSKILRRKFCHRNSLHFIPHGPGLSGMFREFDRQQVRYVVLRWFDKLPEIEPSEDVDLLIADDSLPTALAILHSAPGLQLTDVYSETGLPRSDFCGVAYYAPQAAKRILDGAIRHKNLCYVPSPSDHFHSLAYHAVYHKGCGSGLPTKIAGLKPRHDPGHDYAGLLRGMAAELGIDAEISLEGLHAYLQEVDWAPTADGLARLAAACPRNPWLQYLAKQLTPEMHDQGVTVFVLRQEAIRRGFKEKMISMIEESGFEVLAAKALSANEVDYAATRTRGGNWSTGPYAFPGGPPAVCVVAYDRHPIKLNRKQRRRFPQRTNARIFVKEKIRDAVLAFIPPNELFNALHSSDHAAEAWHLVDILAPEMKAELQQRILTMHKPAEQIASAKTSKLAIAIGTQKVAAAVAVPTKSVAPALRRAA
jgi:hypothetical protein